MMTTSGAEVVTVDGAPIEMSVSTNVPEVAEKTEHCNRDVVESVNEIEVNVTDGPLTTKIAVGEVVVSAEAGLVTVSDCAFTLYVSASRVKDVVTDSAT